MGFDNLFRFWLLDIFGRPAALYLGGAGVGEVVADDVHRQREDHRRVLLRADRVQGLRVRIIIPVLTKFECLKLYQFMRWYFCGDIKYFSVACLEISELKRCGRLGDHVRSLPQRSARLLLTLGRDNLHSGDLTLGIPQINI